MADYTTSGWKVFTGSSDDLGFTIGPDVKRGINVLPDFHMWDSDFVGYVENAKDCGSMKAGNDGGGGSGGSAKRNPCSRMYIARFKDEVEHNQWGEAFNTALRVFDPNIQGNIIDDPNYFLNGGRPSRDAFGNTPAGFNDFDEARYQFFDMAEIMKSWMDVVNNEGWDNFIARASSGTLPKTGHMIRGIGEEFGEQTLWKFMIDRFAPIIKQMGEKGNPVLKRLLDIVGDWTLDKVKDALGNVFEDPGKLGEFFKTAVKDGPHLEEFLHDMFTVAYDNMVNAYLDMWGDPMNKNEGKTEDSGSNPCEGPDGEARSAIGEEVDKLLQKWGRGFNGWKASDGGGGLKHQGTGGSW